MPRRSRCECAAGCCPSTPLRYAQDERWGYDELRAGVPAGWIVGDRTGSGAHDETNDVAILMPPARAPLLVTAYYAGSAADPATRHAVLAEVGRIAASL